MPIIKWFRRMFTDVNNNFINACTSGDLPKVKTLLKQGADIHVWYDWALGGAAEEGHLDVVKYLVEQGASVHVLGDYALRWAAYNRHLDVVKYLVEQGADIHAKADWSLVTAVDLGHLDVVNYLREVAGTKYKCHRCLIKSTCLELCKDFRAEGK